VRDHHELGIGPLCDQHVAKAAHVRLVERGIDLVQKAEWHGVSGQECKKQRHSGERSLPPGEERKPLGVFARWMGHNVNTCGRHVVRVGQYESCGPAAEKLRKVPGKARIHSLYRRPKIAHNDLIQFFDNLLQ